MHCRVFNVPSQLRSAKVALADECLPAVEGHSRRRVQELTFAAELGATAAG